MEFNNRLILFILFICSALIAAYSCGDANQKPSTKVPLDPRILELSTRVEKEKRLHNLICLSIFSGTIITILFSIMGFAVHDYVRDVKWREQHRKRKS
ncbi:conserved Plasmodium protein, unknown function [Plasmodium knowlesi strain H]|uniref:Uncharacterized protein n=2 Tax=Plasmodium knowlesi (strain H) TaxID=5851 RepID=A0A5K1UCZ4_PLAKH|nr:conserved Plasmodium protein, unknown function [Plasmodium knowlesi strain H]CAA9987296.1 conserved Plasmodium protein, unknown function [Plasmodium knowlesi strain H]SBO23430.1 conserved Plasmodium protein, unknown function [Plasmodium knowlesi strain H]SBO24727.1 conserved Plasmodium protein, unknown function [Plasmodium knowlesi strain H]VVS76770.1 conserved Plasmodium protein, unknown function [Plasmodium knowlesi strain H]|eukprot:XP_002258300.1 hypothetical protein, conserved in Plasmodium species [Plasmodium knowlesi strain H]